MTVGSGIAPDLLDPSRRKALAGSQLVLHTAGGDFHPALRTPESINERRQTANMRRLSPLQVSGYSN
jgi:hypothetical protein